MKGKKKRKKMDEGEFYELLKRGQTDFSNCILPFDVVISGEIGERERYSSLLFRRTKIKGNITFENLIIENDISLESANIRNNVMFLECEIGGSLKFNSIGKDETVIHNIIINNSIIKGNLSFNRAKIKNIYCYENTKIGDIILENATIEGEILFKGEVEGNINLNYVKIFEGDFTNARIGGDISFLCSEIENLRFIDRNGRYRASFKKIETEENAYRIARMTQEKKGDRKLADYHYYYEMSARRKQKNLIVRCLEKLFIQYIFGYGTYWHGILITWLFIVLFFAFIFWIGNGIEGMHSIWDAIYFSISTAITLTYGDLRPKSWIYQVIACFEATIGTFMWAAFITIFARKYMR